MSSSRFLPAVLLLAPAVPLRAADAQKREAPCRDHLLEQNNTGSATGLRVGPWKFVPGTAGGRAARRRKAEPEKPAEAVPDRDLPPPAGELYNLADDLGETKNLAAEHPQRAAEMAARLEALKTQGRSRP